MIAGASPLTDRKHRRVLDRARNPEAVSAHAVARYVQDTLERKIHDVALDPEDARAEIRRHCQKAKRIFRGRDCFILQSKPWFLFYRDGTIVSVMHEQSKRKI